MVTIYYFLQNWYQMNSKNSKFSSKKWWGQIPTVPICSAGPAVVHLQGVPADGSNSSVSSYALLPIVLSFDYRATQLDLALNKQTDPYRPPGPVKEIRDEMREEIS